MKARLIAAAGLAVLIALAAGACGAKPSAPGAPPTAAAAEEKPGPGDHQLGMTWKDVPRTYEVHVPPSYRPGATMPLVVAMHYRGGDAVKMRQMTKFDAKADEADFIVAYPNGVGGAMNALICCGSQDDVGFVRSMVEHLIADWGVDANRVYATGISNGADMAFRLSIEATGMFAAIAPVSGGFIGGRAESTPTFRPSTPVSVVSFVGHRDDGKDTIVRGLDVWRQRMGCQSAPVEWLDSSTYRFVSSCADGSEVVSYALQMGHQWPGGAPVGLGEPDTTLNAVDIMWDFFARHPRAATA
jgi:polyhydroxybutyrate depolymerase